MKLTDKSTWEEFVNTNRDFYGAGVIRYAERWANMMEREIENGKNLADIAYVTSLMADTDGITGYMYGCAVSILSLVWEHGKELKRLHEDRVL